MSIIWMNEFVFANVTREEGSGCDSMIEKIGLLKQPLILAF